MSQLAAPTRPVRTARPKPAPPVRRAPRAAGASRIATTRAVAPVQAKRSSRAFMITVFVVALVSALALLMLNTLRAEQSFTLGKLRSDVTTLNDREEALNSEISAVSAPESLAMKANALGMVPAASAVFKSSTSGKTLGVAGSAQAGSSLSVNTLPDTPASKVATDVLASDSIGVHITDPVARAQKAASDKAKADAAKAKADAEAKKKTSEDASKSAPSTGAAASTKK